jgi:putative flippase GtrA
LKRFLEPATFAAVGLAASVVHYIACILLIEQFAIRPWIANIAAFVVSFPVSYLGHSFLTFSARRYRRATATTGRSLRRFLLTSLTGFAVNQASIVLFVEALGQPPRIVLAISTVVVAGLLYLIGKIWVFRGQES